MGVVAPPQRSSRHRTSRCLVLLGYRTASPPPRPWASRLTLANPVFLCRASSTAGVAQWTATRPERLLPLLHPHGAAPVADPGISAASARWVTRMAGTPTASPAG